MQLYLLHRDPIKCAELHADQDCVDMVVRTASGLGSAHVYFDEARYDPLSEQWLINYCDRAIYPPKDCDDAWVAWIRETPENYRWTRRLLEGFLQQYQLRYGDFKGKRHRTWDQLKLLHNPPVGLIDELHRQLPYEMTPWPDVPMQGLDCLRGLRDPIARYRSFYRHFHQPTAWRDGAPQEFRF